MRFELSKDSDRGRTTSMRADAAISEFEGFLQRDHLKIGSRTSASIREIQTTKSEAIAYAISRLMDIAISVIVVIVCLPLILLLAALVALDFSDTPVQWQMRVAPNGRAFKRYRFRTLGPAHDEWGCRLTDAQRSSSLGRFMRASSLDQLPQWANVILGDISIVRIENSRNGE